MGDFLGFILSLSIAMGIGVNLANINITEKDLQEPLKLCLSNEGLKKVSFKVFSEPSVMCNNGAEFTIKVINK